ncbi:hypothetical protein IWQ61_004019 [Dispira simplex]|nr:hypothetical protein IWQ61_004019 [Dispira simplex]
MSSPKLPGLKVNNNESGMLPSIRMGSWDTSPTEDHFPTHYRKPYAAHFPTDSRWGSSPVPQRTCLTPYSPRNYFVTSFHRKGSVDQSSAGPVRSVPASIRQPFQKKCQLIFTEPLTPMDIESGIDKPQRRTSLPEEWQLGQTRSVSPKGTLDIHGYSKTRRFSDDPVRAGRTNSGSPLRTQSYSNSTPRLPHSPYQPIPPRTFSTRPLILHSPYERSFGNTSNQGSHSQGYPHPRTHSGSAPARNYPSLPWWQPGSRAAGTPWSDRGGRSVSPNIPSWANVHCSPKGTYPEPDETVTQSTGYNGLLSSVASPSTTVVQRHSKPKEIQKFRPENRCQSLVGPVLETECTKEKSQPAQAPKTPAESSISTKVQATNIGDSPKDTSPTSPSEKPSAQSLVTQDNLVPTPVELDDSLSSSSGGEKAEPQTSRHPRRRRAVNHEERRQRRLLRNRIAAQECRRKKKLYVKSLEEHVDYLTLQLVKSRKELEEANAKLAIHHGHRMRPEQTNSWTSPYQPTVPDF